MSSFASLVNLGQVAAGGLVIGYIAQWIFAKGLNLSPTLSLSGYGSSVSPFIGIAVLLGLDLWMADYASRYVRANSPLAASAFFFCIVLLQMDEFSALARRTVAPFGGDPLTSQ